MSVAASGGGMNASDNDNGGDGKQGKGMSEIPHSPLSTTDEDDEMEAESKANRRSTLDCLASLEASLPMKRGLSKHYYGRSKSFGNLTDLGTEDSKDLGKKDHAVNKRRRLLIAHEYRHKQLHGRGSSNITHSSSMPAFLSDHRKNEDDDNEDNKKGDDD